MKKVTLALIAILFFASLSMYAAASNLTEARNALDRGDWDTAKRNYSEIHPKDPNWPLKIEDAIRSNLIRGQNLSAWRLTQLLNRTNHPIDKLGYYEKLAVLKSGGCPFGTSIEPWGWELLMQAHGARFYSRFASKGGPPGADALADKGIQAHSQADAMAPFLQDLTRTSIVSGNGCRFDRPAWRDVKSSELAEFDLLRRYTRWIDSHPEETLSNERAVRLRILDLALKHNFEAEAQALLKNLTSFEVKSWLALEPKERRYLWSSLEKAELISTGKISLHHPLHPVLKALIFASDSNEVSYWLSLTEFDTWPTKEQANLYKYLETIELPEHRDEILLRQAILAKNSSDPLSALQFVSRIFKNVETSDQVKMHAEILASEIVSDYQFDEKVLAAIQTALPNSQWQNLFSDLELDAALHLDFKSFNRIQGMILKLGYRRRQSQNAQHALYESIAKGEGSRFQLLLTKIHKENHLQFLQFASLVAKRTAHLDYGDFLKIRPRCLPITELLRKDLDHGKSETQTMDLIHALERASSNSRAAAESAVQGGITHLGAVSLKSSISLANPFQWVPLTSLPRRDLLPFPQDVTGRAWLLR